MTENKPSSEKRIKIDPFYPRLVAAGLLAGEGFLGVIIALGTAICIIKGM